jgi:hypothetical protein
MVLTSRKRASVSRAPKCHFRFRRADFSKKKRYGIDKPKCSALLYSVPGKARDGYKTGAKNNERHVQGLSQDSLLFFERLHSGVFASIKH